MHKNLTFTNNIKQFLNQIYIILCFIACNNSPTKTQSIAIQTHQLHAIDSAIDSSQITANIGKFTFDHSGNALYTITKSNNQYVVSKFSCQSPAIKHLFSEPISHLNSDAIYECFIVRSYLEDEFVVLAIPSVFDEDSRQWSNNNQLPIDILFFDGTLQSTKRWQIKKFDNETIQNILESSPIDQHFCNSYQTRGDTLQFYWNSETICTIGQQHIQFDIIEDGETIPLIQMDNDIKSSLQYKSKDSSSIANGPHDIARVYNHQLYIINDSVSQLTTTCLETNPNSKIYHFKPSQYFCPIQGGFYVTRDNRIWRYGVE